jgi:hypothetical protein
MCAAGVTGPPPAAEEPAMADAQQGKDLHRNLTLNPITVARDTRDAIVHHYKAGTINWPMGAYITLVHVAAVIGLTYVSSAMWQTQLWAFILWPIT